MSDIHAQSTVGSLVAQRPALSRVFEKLGIDYCCGGKETIESVCERKGLDAKTVLRILESVEPEEKGTSEAVDVSGLSLTELAGHIEETHHAYLRSELPRLDALSRKVSAVHGDKEPRLVELREVFLSLQQELTDHTAKEETFLFPLIRRMEEGVDEIPGRDDELEEPIRVMELEHEAAGDALARLRELTDGFQPPEWACNTYRALFHALAQLERDMHRHVHKENHVLFPRALEEKRRRAALTKS